MADFAIHPPVLVTGDNYETGIGTRLFPGVDDCVHINIFNISKINSEVRGDKAPRIKRLSEYIGESYFEYLSKLEDLVLARDFRVPVEEKQLIRGMLFTGFQKCLYPEVKFHSDAERRFTLILEDDPRPGASMRRHTAASRGSTC